MANGFINKRRRNPTGAYNNRQIQEVNRERHDSAQRATIISVGDERRASVYRTDVEFTGTDRVNRSLQTPPRGSQERADLIADITMCRVNGLSYMKTATELDVDMRVVSHLVKYHGIDRGGIVRVNVEDPGVGGDADTVELSFMIKGTKRSIEIPMDEELAEEVHGMLGAQLRHIRDCRRERYLAKLTEAVTGATETPSIKEGRAGYGFRRRRALPDQ